MENTQTQHLEPEIITPVVSPDAATVQSKPHGGKFLPVVFSLVLIAAVGIIAYALMNQNTNNQQVVTETPMVTDTVTPTVSGTPMVTTATTPTPTVQGDAFYAYNIKNTIKVFTKDLVAVATISAGGNVIPCYGPTSDLCIVSGNTIRALEIDRAGKLVATQEFTVASIKDLKDETSVPYIDLEKKAYVYPVSDPKDEMKITYYKKSFSGVRSAKLLTYEGGGTSGYGPDSILSTGEVVFHEQGSVYEPGDARKLSIVDAKGKTRTCMTKQYFDVYYKDGRYFGTGNQNSSTKAETIDFKYLDLLTCKERVIDHIKNVSGQAQDIDLKKFNNSIVAMYTDQQNAMQIRVYSLSNMAQAPITMVAKGADVLWHTAGYREDTQTAVFFQGMDPDVKYKLQNVSKSATISSKNDFPAEFSDYMFQSFLIP